MTSKMGDDLKNGRLPQKWKMTSKKEDDLKNGNATSFADHHSIFFPLVTGLAKGLFQKRGGLNSKSQQRKLQSLVRTNF